MSTGRRRTLDDAASGDAKRMCADELEYARETDSFDTHPDVAKRCIDDLLRIMGTVRPGAIVEPSAGAGNFVRAIRASELGTADLAAIDLYRGGDDVQVGINFLAWLPDNMRRPLWVVGNPPFGRLAETALAFFAHAADFADVIAFIVPREFRRRAYCTDVRFTLVAEHVLERRSFVIGTEAIPYSASTLWQVWRRCAPSEARVYRVEPAPAITSDARVHRMSDATVTQMVEAARDDTPAALGQRFADAGGILMARAGSTPGRVRTDVAAVGARLRRLRRHASGSIDHSNWFFFCVPCQADRDALIAAQHRASRGPCVQGSITLAEAYGLITAALDAAS